MAQPMAEIIQASTKTGFSPNDFWKFRRVSLNIDRYKWLGTLLLLLVLSLAHRGVAQGIKFSPATGYPAGAQTLVTGDFNGDGKMDLVADGKVLLGNGDGSFQTPLNFPVTSPITIVAGDFNHDGKLDLATANSAAGTVSVLLGKGDGTFQSPVDYPAGSGPSRIVSADFNRDGRLDLAVSNSIYTKSMVTVLLGVGNGTFRAPVSYAINDDKAAPPMLATGDFNGDGKADLITANGMGSSYITVFLGNGDGTFQTPINTSGAAAPQTLVLWDFNRDGKLDVAVLNAFAVIMFGNGDGTFTLGPNYSTGNIPLDVKLGDFNGDGRMDLVSIGIFVRKNVRILLGNSDGTFESAGDFVDNAGGLSIAVGDFNRDTKSDLAVSLNNGLGLNVLLNATPGNANNADYFVHQHYLDFLDREPDTLGFNFWSNQITSCGADQPCVEEKRANVSAAFALSTEFQQTAYLAERMYKTAFGDAIATSTLSGAHQLTVPIVRLNELLVDTQQIGQDLVAGQPGWQTVLEDNKQNFVTQFVQRARFLTTLPATLTPTEFVDKLNENAGKVLSSTERATAIALFGGATDTSNTSARGQALRQIAENQNLYNTEFNRAFVLMEYFGYLRRNPDEGPDKDYSGYDFWLTKLNQFNGDFNKSEMVKAFISSNEYRNRFGP
jgi:hypothetical protein